jgi:hypothetical protein
MTRPAPHPTDADWEHIHRFELKFGECWTHCGGYCCKTNHEAQNFSLMKCDSAGMVFMPQEYEFLKRHNRLQTGFEETHRRHTFVFDEARGLKIGYDTAVCALGGICSLPEYRPMICKFYPYYPVVEPESGEVDRLITGSIVDQYWGDLGIEHPCWLHREQGDAVAAAVRATGPALQHPYFIFHLGAAALFVEHVSARCRKDQAALLRGDPRQFFRNWEVLYLTGSLVDRDVLARDIRAFYDRVERRFGAFEL